FPTYTEVECQTLQNFPIVLEESAAFVQMRVTHSLGKRFVVFERVEPRGRLHVIELCHLAQRPCQEAQQIAHPDVISRGCISSEARHVRRTDRSGRNGSQRSVATDSAWDAGDRDSGVISETVSTPHFAAELECMGAFSPAERVAI